MRDFAIHVTHRPGELGRLANVLAKASVNIKSVAGVNFGTTGVVRIIADDVEAARNALTQANIRFEENEIVSVLLENSAGELANVADKLSNAGINLQAVYLTGIDGNLVELALIPDDVKKAKKVLE
ncbi:MAG: hypothetical protein L0Y72_17985 [Gemmataceae bacterium]|nr:hypothetical protein [Gemmataceae bacterium]MCI0639151.1 hypothetical protein [Gemmataceae bacterium]MCI0740941.1 hypothetical protein [Gemmataceae bacterium]